MIRFDVMNLHNIPAASSIFVVANLFAFLKSRYPFSFRAISRQRFINESSHFCKLVGIIYLVGITRYFSLSSSLLTKIFRLLNIAIFFSKIQNPPPPARRPPPQTDLQKIKIGSDPTVDAFNW